MLNIFISVILLLSPAERDSLLAGIETNSAFWEEALSQYSGNTLAQLEYLLVTMSPEDREAMSTALLEDHLLNALRVRNDWYDTLPDSIFQRYLLPFRIWDEPLSSYRSSLEGWLSRRLQNVGTSFEMAEAIKDLINHSISLTASGTDDTHPTPTQIIPVGQASRDGMWILLGSSLRTMGIPARPVWGWFPGVERNLYMWFDVWTGEEWRPLYNGMPPVNYVKAAVEYPSMRNITGEYRDTGRLITTPLGDFTEGNWTVELLIPAGEDTTSIEPIQLSPFIRDSVDLGTGEFLLRVQFREGDSLIGSWIQNVVIYPDSSTIVELSEAQYSMTILP
jgi:hypothetical protein